MYLCDKCRFYDKCFPKTMNAYDEFIKKADVELGGCPNYDELTISDVVKEM